MATVNKDFKIKSGLVVEGSSATVGGYDVLTKKQADQDYVVGLIGGTATSANTANTVVKRDGSGNFAAGTITATITGNVTGDVTGNVTGNLTGNVTGNVTGSAGTVTSLSGNSTTGLSEGTNLYFTEERAQDAIGNNVGTGLSYNDTTGAVSVTANTYDAYGAAAAAQAAAEATAASALTSAISTEVTNRNSAIGTAVSNLVDGAPALLNTLNELADALGDSPDTITNLTTLVGTKAPLASPALTGVPTAPTAAADTSTTQIATTAFAKAEADAAQSAAETTAQGYASTAQTNAQTFATNAINGLDTDDIEEGAANLYHTDVRAKASAAALLTGATKTNITITGSGSGLVITAENGVADSTTSDLAEGSNLYFTDARAVDALEAVVPNFTAVELNSVAKQVAATLSAPTAGVQTAHAFAKADYRSAEYLVKIANGSNTDVSKVLLTLDSSDNIAITEYGMVSTGSSLGSVSASISGANVQLLVTTANNTSTVTVVGTLLA